MQKYLREHSLGKVNHTNFMGIPIPLFHTILLIAIGLGNFEKILKIFDENPIENLNFYLVLGKVVAINRAYGNNTIFYNNFSGSGCV